MDLDRERRAAGDKNPKVVGGSQKLFCRKPCRHSSQKPAGRAGQKRFKLSLKRDIDEDASRLDHYGDKIRTEEGQRHGPVGEETVKKGSRTTTLLPEQDSLNTRNESKQQESKEEE